MRQIIIRFLSIVILIVTCHLSSLAQQSRVNKWLFGDGTVAAHAHLSADIYPFLFFAGGGGTVGFETGHWQMGLAGFTVKPPEFIKTTFFRNADNITIERNNAIELFANYYLRPDRKGLHVGLIGGPEWFLMRDDATAASEWLTKIYLVPKVGIRIFPFKEYFYIDPSIGWSFNLSSTGSRTLGASTYNSSRGGLLYFFQLGCRFPLKKN